MLPVYKNLHHFVLPKLIFVHIIYIVTDLIINLTLIFIDGLYLLL